MVGTFDSNALDDKQSNLLKTTSVTMTKRFALLCVLQYCSTKYLYVHTYVVYSTYVLFSTYFYLSVVANPAKTRV